MKKIFLSVLALAAVLMAGAQTVRTLVVTDKDGVTREFPADQVDGIMFEEAPEYIPLTNLLFTRYEESDNSGMYNVEFGTAEPGADGMPANIGDMQVALLLRAPKSESLTEPKLPEGYYGIGNNTSDYTFDINKSVLYVRSAEGDEGVGPAMIFNGTVDVRVDGEGVYDIRMELITSGGPVNFRYQGAVGFEGGYSEYETFSEPVDLEYANGQGRFWGNWYYLYSADLMTMFSVGEIEDGEMKDGYILSLYFTEPKPEDCMAPNQRVADGTYSVESRNIAASSYLPFRYTPGSYDYIEILGQKVLSGARLEYISRDGRRKFGLITDGTFTVSENGTKFEFDLMTKEGIPVTGSYTGVPVIENYCDNDVKEPKRPYSTLVEDVNLEWIPSTVAYAINEGHSVLEDINNVAVMVTDPNMKAGDFIMFDLLTSSDGLADGTYTVDRTLADGHIFPGTVDFAGSMMKAWYGDLDSTDDEGYQEFLGPIESGTVTVSTLGDGTRKIEFDVTDDNGHAITGSYVGEIIEIVPEQARMYRKASARVVKSRKASVRR